MYVCCDQKNLKEHFAALLQMNLEVEKYTKSLQIDFCICAVVFSTKETRKELHDRVNVYITSHFDGCLYTQKILQFFYTINSYYNLAMFSV